MASPSLAIDVTLDYGPNPSAFFFGDPTAKAAVDKAAADVSAAITTSLNQTSPSNSATVGSSSATFNDYFDYTNPYTNAPATYVPPSGFLPQDQVRIFVGARNLPGGTLGVGGFTASIAASGSSANAADFTNALNQAATAATANLRRGGGPEIATLAGTLGSDTYEVKTGSNLGQLSLDNDTNNDNVTDDAATLSSFFHYDPNAPVTAGKNDLYSVALHEILHAIGIGGSNSWNARRTGGDDWTGPNVIALLGTGTNVLNPVVGDHIREGIAGARLGDLASQEAAMDPTLTTGTRKFITDVDLAFLRDIGWNTVAVPEPTALAAVGVCAVGLLARRRRADAAAR